MGLAKYLKAAFLNRWNILALGAGMAVGLISGLPDVVIPLVLAVEAAYLGFLGTHPRFQDFVNAQEAASQCRGQSRSSEQALRQILQSLPGPAIARFEKLRNQCLELRQIAADLAHSRAAQIGTPLDSFQLEGLDRLLWIFLRLLFTEWSLRRFLDRTSPQQIKQEIEAAERRLAALEPNQDSPHTQKILRVLQDGLQTSRDRLANYEKAKANHELVMLEIDRLETKIKSLAELAVNRQEPDFISEQVDQVAGSMLEAEKTMNELQFATGLAPIDEEAPDLMRPPVVQALR
jgi:hypothetical protein